MTDIIDRAAAEAYRFSPDEDRMLRGLHDEES